MKSKFGKADIFSIAVTIFIIVGVLCSFIDFGILSVFFSVIMPIIFFINVLLAIYGIIKKKYFAIFGVLIFLTFFKFFYQFSAYKNSELKGYISVLTYNTMASKQPLSLGSKKNTSAEIIKFIDSIHADILLFQEASNKDITKIKHYPYIFLGYREGVKKSLLSIYSKYPIINKGFIDFPNTLNNAIYADIKIHQDTIRIYNTHLQSFIIDRQILKEKFNDYNYLKTLNNTNTKQIEQAKLIKNNALKSNKKAIICGDFNATPYSQTYRILQYGMNDSFISKGKGFGKTFSFFKFPLRLDYFLSDAKINVISHINFTLNLSDHEPVFIKFKIK